MIIGYFRRSVFVFFKKISKRFCFNDPIEKIQRDEDHRAGFLLPDMQEFFAAVHDKMIGLIAMKIARFLRCYDKR